MTIEIYAKSQRLSSNNLNKSLNSCFYYITTYRKSKEKLIHHKTNINLGKWNLTMMGGVIEIHISAYYVGPISYTMHSDSR